MVPPVLPPQSAQATGVSVHWWSARAAPCVMFQTGDNVQRGPPLRGSEFFGTRALISFLNAKLAQKRGTPVRERGSPRPPIVEIRHRGGPFRLRFQAGQRAMRSSGSRETRTYNHEKYDPPRVWAGIELCSREPELRA